MQPQTLIPNRAHEIDGIRGWAAVIVLFGHVLSEMLGYFYPVLRTPVLLTILSGHYAVLIFFVLSGDALSISFFTGKPVGSPIRLVAKRYLRLTIPILMSCTGVYLIMCSGMDFHAEASKIVRRPEWLGSFLQLEPTWLGLLKFSTFDVYKWHPPGAAYNPFLWTMGIELKGSLLVFAAFLGWRRLPRAFVIILIGMIALLARDSYLALFIAEMFFAKMRADGFFDAMRRNNGVQMLTLLIFAALLAFLVKTSAKHIPYISLMIAIVGVFSMYMNRYIVDFMSNNLSRFLGDISFPLYLVHFWVIISLMSYLLIQCDQGGCAQPYPALIGLCAVMASVALALAFYHVERRALYYLNKILKVA